MISLNSIFIVNEGLEVSKGRVGADVVVLSSKSSLDVGSFIYSGESTNCYVAIEELDFLKNFDEVDKMTTEFFTHTLSAGCCSVGEKLRIVGIDQDTDFILKPWLEENHIERFTDSQALIGDDVAIPLGSKMALLGAPFDLVGSLYRTGTGMDRTIYIDIDVARKLAKKKMQKSIFKGREPSELVTAVFIKLKDGVSAEAFVDRVNSSSDVVKAYSKSGAIDGIESSIDGWTKLAIALVFMVILNSYLSLYGRFSFSLNERKKEIGYLRAVGFRKGHIVQTILYEVLIISVVSGIIAAMITLALMPVVMDFVTKQFFLPAESIGFMRIITVIVEAPLLVFALSFISILKPAIAIINMEPRMAISKGVK